MSTQESRQELDEWVADAVRDGFTVDSRVGVRAFISKKVGVSGLAVFVYIVLIIVLFPIGLLFIIPWVNASKRVIRFELYVGDDGEVVQEKIGKTEEQVHADRVMGRNMALAGLAVVAVAVVLNVAFGLTIANFAILGGLIVAIYGAWKYISARD